MPRALRLDVRSLANADSPVLSFLAPRAFAESPFRRSTHTGNARASAQSQRKEDGATEYEQDASSSIGIQCPGSLGCHLKITRLRHATCPLRVSPLCLSSQTGYSFSTASKSSGLSYAYISSFTRQQLASYSTGPISSKLDATRLAPKIRSILSRRTRGTRVHTQLSLKDGGTSDPQRQLPQNASPYRRFLRRARRKDPRKLPPDEENWLLNHRRKKALRVELNRFETFTSNVRVANATNVIKNSRYRSLQRRIFALSQSKIITLDMTHSIGDFRPSVLIRGFAALDRKAYPARKRTSHSIKMEHNAQVIDWALALCGGSRQACHEEHMWTKWSDMTEEDRNASWHLILLYLLDQEQHQALQFLRVLAHGTRVSTLKNEYLADALEHIARLCASSEKMSRRILYRSAFIPTFTHIFREHLAKTRNICSQDLLWNIAHLATLDDLKLVFDGLIEHKANLGYDTLLHYANRFGELGAHEYALRCLQRVVERAKTKTAGEVLVARERFRWSCALVLRRSVADGQNYHLTTDIVAQFLKLGVKLDILLYNVIMHNAMETGDYSTAFRVFNLLKDNGLEPNKQTFSILLQGCTMAKDPAMFQEFAQHCARKAKELRDPRLATDYLYYLYVRHSKDGPSQLFAILNDAYCQLFSPEPLLPVFPQKSRLQDIKSAGLMEAEPATLNPPPAAVYVMFQAIIQQASSQSNEQVWKLSQIFKKLVEDGYHPKLSELARNPIIWNAFLLAFCRSRQFANASELIKTMTDGDPAKFPKPNVYSWNIFMQAFFKTDQVRAAERIYEIMRSRGIQPNQFSYGVLLRGYVKAQNTEKIGEVMGHIENDRQLDPMLLQALTRVHDRKRLMYELEKSRLAKEEEQREKQKLGEEAERKRWERPQFKSMLPRPKLTLSEVLEELPQSTNFEETVSEPSLEKPATQVSATETHPLPAAHISPAASLRQHHSIVMAPPVFEQVNWQDSNQSLNAFIEVNDEQKEKVSSQPTTKGEA